MREEQKVSNTVEEALARQAMALIQRSGEPLIEVLEAILGSPAGDQPVDNA